MRTIRNNYRSFRAVRGERLAGRGRVRGLASQRAQRKRRASREIDADTIRHRALNDARGQVLRHGCTYCTGGETHWRIVRSLRGRIDQRDVIVNGELLKTCGPRKLPSWLR